MIVRQNLLEIHARIRKDWQRDVGHGTLPRRQGNIAMARQTRPREIRGPLMKGWNIVPLCFKSELPARGGRANPALPVQAIPTRCASIASVCTNHAVVAAALELCADMDLVHHQGLILAGNPKADLSKYNCRSIDFILLCLRYKQATT